MITVENLLDAAYVIALDLWSDPELAILENGHPRENPTPEYATLIRKVVSAENAKLREERDMYRDLVGLMDHPDLNVQLQAENAKLRELACTLVYCMQVHNDCDGCRLNGSKGELSYDPLLACDGLHERMRELGIEVDA